MINITALVRLCAMLLLWAGILLLIRNLLLSFDSFNPSYLFHYFRQELLTPVLLIFASLIMRYRSSSIARKITQDSSKAD